MSTGQEVQAFSLCCAKVRGKKQNAFYPDERPVHTLDDLLKIAQLDHTPGFFKDAHRGKLSWYWQECIVLDVDNTDGGKVTNPADIARDFPGVGHYIIYSRHHNKPKVKDDGKGEYPAAPRFHVYFPINSQFTGAKIDAFIKKAIASQPYFDPFIKWARKQGYTTLHEKMLDLEVPKGARTKEKHILQPESLRVLFSTETCLFRGKLIFDDNIYCYRFIVASGLRPGEAVGLRLGDFTGRRVDISRSINRYNETTKGKNENAVRYIEMNDKAYEAYMGQLYLLQAWRVPRTPDTPLFPLVNQQSLYNHWRHYQETNGIPHISLYELRHTFVSIAQDLPDGKLKALVGHSKNMDTRGTYAHRIEGQAHETATAMTAAFDKVLNA